MTMQPHQKDQISWVSLVERTRAGDVVASQQLCAALADAARMSLHWGMYGEAVEDDLQDVVVTLLEAIRDDAIREPECLMGFLRTVARRRACLHIRANVRRRQRLVEMGEMDFEAPVEHSPETGIVLRERTQALQTVLRQLCPRDYEIVTRFYLEEQSQEQICREMGLTSTQFRLYKSRALARCSQAAGSGNRFPRPASALRRIA